LHFHLDLFVSLALDRSFAATNSSGYVDSGRFLTECEMCSSH